MKRNLVGNGTSVRSPRYEDSESLMKARIDRSSSVISPMRMLEASASFGIFLMKFVFDFSFVGLAETSLGGTSRELFVGTPSFSFMFGIPGKMKKSASTKIVLRIW